MKQNAHKLQNKTNIKNVSKKITVVLSLAFCLNVQSQNYTINTIAGTSIGFSGDGGLATSAQLGLPTGVAIDAAGNVYYSDYNYNRIRKITISTGIITTIAGTNTVSGSGGYSGDGGLATAAQLNYPMGLALDALGNVYIADYGNHCIRKITVSTGIITTVVGTGTAGFSGDGGVAASAQISAPYSIAFDVSSNMYIADCGNVRIRKITASTNIITTIAGTGSSMYSGDGGLAINATFNHPVGIAADAQGNVYVADNSSNRVRKIAAATGIITTIAGIGGGAGYGGDNNLATSAQLNSPMGVSIDASGNVYIADYGNSRIRKISALTGVISTIAGDGSNGFSGDGGVATSAKLFYARSVSVDALGNAYIADYSNYRIRKLTKGTCLAFNMGNVSASKTLLCLDSTVAGMGDLVGLTPSGTGDFYVFSFPTGGLATVVSGASININVLSTSSYSVFSVMNNGCMSSNTLVLTISVDKTPTVSVNNSAICVGNSVTLTPSGANTYTISGGIFTVSPANTTTYAITGTSSLGCLSSNTVVATVSVVSFPTVSISNTVVCAGNSVTLKPSGASTYTISGGAFTVSPVNTTTYAVTGTSSLGCLSNNTAVATVSVNLLPVISISGSSTVCLNTTGTLSAYGANTYTWSNNQNGTTIIVSPNISTSYSVQGTDNNGCVGSNSSATLYVDVCTEIKDLNFESSKWRVYPNPVEEILNVELEILNEKQIEISVYNTLGTEVIHNSTFLTHNFINLSNFSKGIYFIKVGDSIKKFVKE